MVSAIGAAVRAQVSRGAGSSRSTGARAFLFMVAGLAVAGGLPSPAAALPVDSLPPMLRARLDSYILPRAFPDSSISKNARRQARTMMDTIRGADGLPHGRPWSPDSAVVGDTLAPPPGPCGWHSIGPTNISGRVTGIAFDPDDPDRVFASTVGGVWRSIDGGRVWHRVTDNVGGTIGAPSSGWSCVAAAGGGSADVYAGTGDPNYAVSIFSYPADSSWGEGIWRSQSNGDAGTWTKTTLPDGDHATVFRIRIDPTAPHLVYAATSVGVYVGTPSGSTVSWERADSQTSRGTQAFVHLCSHLAASFGSGGTILYAGVAQAGTASGVWRRSNGRWEHCNSGIAPRSSSSGAIGAVALALDPSNADVLYARIADADDERLYGIFKTTSASEAASWTPLLTSSADSDDGQCWYNNVVEVDPTDPRRIAFGGVGCLLSADGGATASPAATSADGKFGMIHEDVHALAFDPAGAHCLWCGNDGGLDRSTDLSAASWHWEHTSHGMSTTELLAIGTQTARLPALSSGAQDDGNTVTFGNRTWYPTDLDKGLGTDATGTGIDAGNALWCYLSDNGDLRATTNPILATAGGLWSPGFAPDAYELAPPVAVDPTVPLRAIAAGRVTDADGNFLRPSVFESAGTLDANAHLDWDELTSSLTTNEWVASVAIAPSSGFTHFLVGLRNTRTGTAHLGRYLANATGTTPKWKLGAGTLPGLSPNGVAFATGDETRAFAAFGGAAGGKLTVSIDGGDHWQQATDRDANGLPIALSALTCVAADPTKSNVIYVGTMAGVLQGTVTWPTATSPPSVVWAALDHGIPADVDVTALAVNAQAGTIVAATMGYGAFERPLGDGACADPMLIVRDNVFDRGSDPSPSDEPDPEHPIETPAGSHRYVPASDPADRVYWWSSTDIRVDDSISVAVPAANAVPAPGVQARSGNTLEPDHVEIESCPIDHLQCPPGTMIDAAPVQTRRMRVHVQVADRGTHPASHVRVMVLWADANVALGPLPSDFWTTDFPPSGSSPPYTDPGPWQPIDPQSPSRTIDVVDPDQPGVATFDWDVPRTASDHCCLIAIADSPDDPLEDWIRDTPQLDPSVLVPRSRHIAQRNVHPISLLEAALHPELWIAVHNTAGWLRNYTLRFSRAESPRCLSLGVDLPTPLAGARATKASAPAGYATIPIPSATLTIPHVPIGPRSTLRVGIRYVVGCDSLEAPARFSMIAERDTVGDRSVIGGNTFIVRGPLRSIRLPARGKRVAAKRAR